MRARTLLIVSLGILLIPGVLWSMEKPQKEVPRTIVEAQTARPRFSHGDATVMKIFVLRYHQADLLARVIGTLIPEHEATIAVDEVSQKLIVAASPDRLEQIERVIAELDVRPAHDAETPQMMYRIYMLELPHERGDMKPFSMVLKRSAQLPPTQLLDAVNDAEVQIGTFFQNNEEIEGEAWELVIQGQAASNEAVKRVVERIPDSQLKELRWENGTSTPPAAQVTQLPDQLRGHIDKLLGPGVQTAGYWFGNLSVPGNVQAPIGPWVFDMGIDKAAQEGEVELEITVVREPKVGSDPTWQIMSNSVRGRLNKPVIIGYNRDHYGTRVTGAMVIVPEVSPLR